MPRLADPSNGISYAPSPPVHAPPRSAPRVMAAAMDEVWAITPGWLEQILAIADRAGEDPEALATRLGRRLEKTQSIQMRESVAVATISGPILRYGNMFSDISGATSLDGLATDLQAAVDNPDVAAILLSFDSPGGQVTGIGDLAAAIRGWSEQKMIVAHVEGMGASAAYWLAAAAPTLYISSTAMVGSIGVVTAYRDQTERDAKAGVRNIEIVSSNAPNKRPDVATDEGRALVRDRLDALESRFVDAVAGFRGVDGETVRSDFGRGGVLIGSDAVDAGMADEIASF